MWSFNCFRVESICTSTSRLTHPEEHSNKALRSKAVESSKAGWWVCLIYPLIPIHALPGLPGEPAVHNLSNTPVLFFKQKKVGPTNWLHEIGWFGPNLPTICFGVHAWMFWREIAVDIPVTSSLIGSLALSKYYLITFGTNGHQFA